MAKKSGAAGKGQAGDSGKGAEEHAFVTAYLTRLEAELQDSPAVESEQLIESIRAEFASRLSGIAEPTGKQVLAISASLGQPREVAIRAGLVSPQAQIQRGEPGWFFSRGALILALTALVLTLISSLAALVAGVVAGVLVALSVPRWQAVRKPLVVAIITLVVAAIILVVQLFGASQAT